jgi:hypothetical protein
MQYPPTVKENILEEIDEDMSSVNERDDEEEKLPPEMNTPRVKDKLDKLHRKKFSFFFKRTCFRLMADFYKYLF